MDWNIVIQDIFTVVLIPLLGLLAKYFIKFVNIKIEEMKSKQENDTYKKYLSMLDNTIASVVTATNQTYVEALKEQGKFDVAAQKEALRRTYTTVLAILGEDAQTYLSEAIGDLQQYIIHSIECQVNINKTVTLVTTKE